MTDPSALLRERTRARHDALEGAGWLDEALADRPAYARHLARTAAFHAAAERALAPHLRALEAAGFEPLARRKSPLIARERLALHGAAGSTAHVAFAAFPALTTLSDAVGAAYVLEGATLGGVVIAGLVRDRLGWNSTYYHGYGRATAERWRTFREAARAVAPLLDPDRLVAAADATYDAYALIVAGAALRGAPMRTA